MYSSSSDLETTCAANFKFVEDEAFNLEVNRFSGCSARCAVGINNH